MIGIFSDLFQLASSPSSPSIQTKIEDPGGLFKAPHNLEFPAQLPDKVASNLEDARSSRPSRVHYPLTSLPDDQLFRHVLSSFLMSTLSPEEHIFDGSHQSTVVTEPRHLPGLKKIPPYWYPYTTMAKGRWLGREILEVVSTEFRDRSMEYYVRPAFSLS